MTPAQRRLIVPIVSLTLGVLLLAVTAWVTLRQPAGGGGPVIGGAFQLTSQDGKPISNKDMSGRPFLVFFGFTNCPDVCPTALREISDVFAAMGEGAKVSALFITVDPERDTPASLKDYISNFDPRILGLTGTREQIDATMKSYRVYARKVPGENGAYSMDHSSIIYLMDKQGRFVGSFNINRPPQDAAAELKRFL